MSAVSQQTPRSQAMAVIKQARINASHLWSLYPTLPHLAHEEWGTMKLTNIAAPPPRDARLWRVEDGAYTPSARLLVAAPHFSRRGRLSEWRRLLKNDNQRINWMRVCALYLVNEFLPYVPQGRNGDAQVAVWAVPLALPQSGALKRKIKRSRNCPVSIRITQAEKSSLRRRAQAVGISVNAYLKACALIGEYVPPYPPDILQELRRVHWELTRQGHNLNQMAKHLNDGSLTPRHGFSKLDAIEAPLSRALDAVGKALTWGKTYPE